ncbi:ABC-2 transporter permease [Paucisalibacillus sp. EB02]|uniref:ABC-2 transporter permease n=1 Tax=Paucisalibacillus sp. EB02 TaxID=1347087 RepID=UPI0004AC7E2B|nr:ABC-2 transporter permease [Paucisalibacillus sp. EB02]
MWQLFIRDWKSTKLYILVLFAVIPISYAIHFPSSGIFIWALLSLLFIVFLIEKQNNVDLFLVSLPLRRKEMVLARYIFLISLSIISIGFLWLVDLFFHNVLPSFGFSRLDLIDIIQQFWVTTLLFSIYVPVFYYFKQFIHAAIFFIISFTCLIYLNVLMVGNPLITFDDPIRAFIIELYSIQPYLMPILLSIISLCISYPISVQLLIRKDII